jgi:hypothetical protein
VFVNRKIMLEHLAMAERHVASGEGHLRRQETLIGELDRGGHGTTDACAILATMRQTQELHVQDRDRILRELEAEA